MNFIAALLSFAVTVVRVQATCTAGSDQCLYCLSATHCGMCEGNYWLDTSAGTCASAVCGGTCTKGCESGSICCIPADSASTCLTCTGDNTECDACLPGYFVDNNKCTGCDSACGACTAAADTDCCPKDCAKCEVASRRLAGGSKSSEPTCSLCFNGLPPDGDGACGCATETENPVSACTTCNAAKTECTACEATYKLTSSGTCVKCDTACEDPATCLDTGRCPQPKGCADGAPEDGTCLYCLDDTDCGMCKQGHILDADAGKCSVGQCGGICADGCSPTAGCCGSNLDCETCTDLDKTKCDTCMAGKYKHTDNTCKECADCEAGCIDAATCCPENCATCTAGSKRLTAGGKSTGPTCELCFNGIKVDGAGKCGCATTAQNAKSKCTTCSDDKTACTACAAEHKVTAEGKCQKCDAACANDKSCEDDGTCPTGGNPADTTKEPTEDGKNTTTSSGAKSVFVMPLFALMFFSKFIP